jgi:hypothetical protein
VVLKKAKRQFTLYITEYYYLENINGAASTFYYEHYSQLWVQKSLTITGARLRKILSIVYVI